MPTPPCCKKLEIEVANDAEDEESEETSGEDETAPAVDEQ